MSEIRHFTVAFSTHTLFFAVGGITSDLRHPTNVGWRSDTPWCLLFDHFLFQSVNQNLHKPLKIRSHSTLEASAFRRTEVSEEWRRRRYFYPESVRFSTPSDTWRVGLPMGKGSEAWRRRRRFDSDRHLKRRLSNGQKRRSHDMAIGGFHRSVGRTLEKWCLLIDLTKKSEIFHLVIVIW